jgi:hypothetical protein
MVKLEDHPLLSVHSCLFNIFAANLRIRILGWILEVGWSDVDWIGLAKDKNRWRPLVNSILNLRVP